MEKEFGNRVYTLSCRCFGNKSSRLDLWLHPSPKAISEQNWGYSEGEA